MDAVPPSGHALGALLALVAVCGACDGLVSGALYGEAAVLAPRYTQALTAGNSLSGGRRCGTPGRLPALPCLAAVTAATCYHAPSSCTPLVVAGIVVALLRAGTKATLPDTEPGLRQSADIYFSIAAAACLACLMLHALVLPRLATVRSRRGAALEAALLDSSDDLPGVPNGGGGGRGSWGQQQQQPEAAPLLGPAQRQQHEHEGSGGGGGGGICSGEAPATAADVLRRIWVLGLSNILIFM